MFKKALTQGCALPLACLFATGFAVATSAQVTAPQAPARASVPAATLPAAQTIVDRHIQAIGGRDAMKGLTSMSAKGTISVPANGMSGTVEVFAARPNKQLARMVLAGIGEASEGYDGTVGWSKSPMTGPMLATGEELVQKAFDAQFDAALGVGSRYDAMKTLEKTTFEGRPAFKLAMTRKTGGDDFHFYDAETGLKLGSIVSRKNPMGTISVTVSLGDYKKFGSLLQATVMKQTMSGVQMVTTVQSIEYNTVPASVFELPTEIKALVK